jgi:hypothetical protein
MRRKILMGVFALALPVGTLAAFSPTASAKAAQNPIHCAGVGGGGGGVVTFGTPITASGTVTASKTGIPTSITGGNFNCGGGTNNASDQGSTIAGGKNAKNASYNKKTCSSSPSPTVCDKYVTGSQAEFLAAGGSLKKGLRTINFTINGNPVLFQAKTATEDVGGVCGGDVGFTINGQVKSGFYADKSAVVNACLGDDSGPGTSHSFGVDLFSPTAKIITAQIDPATSSADL